MASLDEFVSLCSPADCTSNYGSSMLVSSAADWIELASLVSPPHPLNDLIDLVCDSTDTRTYKDYILDSGQDAAEEHDLDESIRNMLCERKGQLGKAYPFEFDDFNRYILKDGFNSSGSHYLILLLLSCLKGWGDNGDIADCANLFERIVGISFHNAGYESAIMGTSGQGGFAERLRGVGDKLGLGVDPAAAPLSAKAKDGGVDVIAGRFWHDGRKGENIFLIQAACGKESNQQWEGKLAQVSILNWRDRFLERSDPYAYLAVPYHLTDDAVRAILSRGGNHSFVDRIRLVKLSGGWISFSSDYEKELAERLANRVSERFKIDQELCENIINKTT